MEGFLQVQHRVYGTVLQRVGFHAGAEWADFGDGQRRVAEHSEFGLDGLVLVAVRVVVVKGGIRHRHLRLAGQHAGQRTGDGKVAVRIGHIVQASHRSGLPVDHLVVDPDKAVGDGRTQLVLEGSGHDHRLGHRLAGQRINLAGVDDLVVHVKAGAANQREAVGVVGHDHAEVVVTGHAGARVPHALDAKGGHVKRRAALVGQVLLETQDDVHGTETVRQEGFGILTEKLGVERRDVGAQAADALFAAEAVLVDVAVRESVTVGVVEAKVGAVRLRLWERHQTCAWRQGGDVLTVLDAFEIGAFEDHVHKATRGWVRAVQGRPNRVSITRFTVVLDLGGEVPSITRLTISRVAVDHGHVSS